MHVALFSFAEQTCERLIDALLCGDPRARRVCLCDAISNDPRLGQWASDRASASGRPPLKSAGDLSAWLADVLLAELVAARQASTQAANGAASRAAATDASTRLAALVDKLTRLAKLERDFERLLEHEKLESLKELAYGAGHEINNPLANISARAQTLLVDERDPERRRKLAAIHTQAMRAHEMIADMMLFARPPRPQSARFELGQWINELLDALAATAAAQETAIAWQPPDQPIEVEADKTQLAVAVRALIGNALDALGQGGKVSIDVRAGSLGTLRRDTSAAKDQPVVQIVVTDDGPGISPDVRRHIFDPFFSGREAGRGLGFGLSKCWRIVTMHGGSIDVESEPAQGAKFTITLPCNSGAVSVRQPS